ncbi:MAG: type II secretion system F family protein [Planctomycetota bacterium]|jgi:type IV pilus assembly protein PilC
MPIYKYEAMDSQGVGIKDEIEALSQKEAISKIRNMGYFPTKVLEHGAKKREAARAPAAVPKTKRGANSKVKVKYVTQFARQLSTLQDAGLPILRSLRILEEQQKSGKFKRIIRYLGDDIEGGSTLSEAFARYPRAFDRLFVGMVAAGETGGVLDLILARIADFMEKAQKLKSRVKSAMIYPIFVMSAAFGIVLLLMKFVIPSFRDTLTEMTDGASLPALTERVLGLSNWIAYHYGWAIIIAMPIGLVILLKITRQFSIGRYILDSIKLRLPIIGQLSGKIAVTRWTRTLGTHNSIRQGETFAAPLKQSRTVDSIVSNMIAVGEETGELDKMMLKIADNYDEQVDVLVSSLMSLLEPVLIIMLGSIVAVIVLSVFMPMIQIITSLSV